MPKFKVYPHSYYTSSLIEEDDIGAVIIKLAIEEVKMPKFKVWITQCATIAVKAKDADNALAIAEEAFKDHDPSVEYFEPTFEHAVKIVEKELKP